MESKDHCSHPSHPQNCDKPADTKHCEHPEKVDVVAVVKIKPDCIEAFRNVLQEQIDATRKE
jgi:hypothetical protein